MRNTKDVTQEKYFRPLEELNLMDNFLFQTIVTQGEDGEEFCRILLSTFLGKSILSQIMIMKKIPFQDV